MRTITAKRITAAVLWVLLTAGICTAAYAEENTGTYVSGTKINSVGVAGLTPEEAKSRVEAFYDDVYTLTIQGRNGAEASFPGTDISYRVEIPAERLQEILDQQPGNPPLLRTGRVQRKEKQ